jgi:predicted DNA-binding protein YlxM (UPF0122 family)
MKRMYKNIDPHEIQKRFSSDEHSFYKLDGKSFKFEDFLPYISKLPQREIDLIEMYFRKEKKQKEIADFFGVTQGAISHRIKRAKKRLLFLRDMPKINEDIKDILEDHFEPFEIDLIILMVETTCQSKTAEILNTRYKLKDKQIMTQVKIRHKFDRYLKKLEKLKKGNPQLEDCYRLIVYIKKNLYMLHEVKLPHFDKGYSVVYDQVL